MSLCYLLHMMPPPMQEDTFAFEHEMAHRTLWGSMSPLTRYSVLPYILVPGTNHDAWHQNHEWAHRDFQGVLPGWFGGIGFDSLRNGIVPPDFIFPILPEGQTGTISQLAPSFLIEEYDLTIGSQLEWWTWQNHTAHLNAQSAQNLETAVFPFF